MTELMVFESIKIDDRMVFEELMFLSLLTGNTVSMCLTGKWQGIRQVQEERFIWNQTRCC